MLRRKVSGKSGFRGACESDQYVYLTCPNCKTILDDEDAISWKLFKPKSIGNVRKNFKCKNCEDS